MLKTAKTGVKGACKVVSFIGKHARGVLSFIGVNSCLRGKKVRINHCADLHHGDNEACVCHLKGKNVEIGNADFKHDGNFTIRFTKYHVGRKEVTILRDQNAKCVNAMISQRYASSTTKALNV